jgi:hypothetical protein
MKTSISTPLILILGVLFPCILSTFVPFTQTPLRYNFGANYNANAIAFKTIGSNPDDYIVTIGSNNDS